MAGFLVYINNYFGLFSQMRDAKYIVFSMQNYLKYTRLDAFSPLGFHFVVNERDEWLSLPGIINALSDSGFAMDKIVFDWRNGEYYCRAKNLLPS